MVNSYQYDEHGNVMLMQVKLMLYDSAVVDISVVVSIHIEDVDRDQTEDRGSRSVVVLVLLAMLSVVVAAVVVYMCA